MELGYGQGWCILRNLHQELVGLTSVKTSVIFLTEVELLAFTTDYFQVVLVYDISMTFSMTFLLPSQLLSPEYKPPIYVRVIVYLKIHIADLELENKK
ncbi:MAG: hypothetical protein IJA34_17415 [Lachnospiraceae bacterium]|nr:hypothetical protein [Lachnospiraceae bacterium]